MPDVVLSKKFDARNGNGAAIGVDTYPSATIIAYQDAIAKAEVIDAVCALANYDALDLATRPSKQAFFNREINFWLRDKVRQRREQIEAAKIVAVDTSDLP